MSRKIADWNTPNVGLVVPDEHTEQKNLVRSVREHLPREVSDNLAAMPNGQLRDVRVARKLKAEGQSNGYPDLLLDLPRGPFHGFRGEMKRLNATESDWHKDQRAWNVQLNANGFLSVVARGAHEMFVQIQAFYQLGPFDPSTPVDLTKFQLKLVNKGRNA